MVNVLHEFARENLVMQLHQKLHSEILLYYWTLIRTFELSYFI